jgi:hypothetical protein
MISVSRSRRGARPIPTTPAVAVSTSPRTWVRSVVLRPTHNDCVQAWFGSNTTATAAGAGMTRIAQTPISAVPAGG